MDYINNDIVNAELLELGEDLFYAKFSFMDENGEEVSCIFDEETLADLIDAAQEAIEAITSIE